MPVIPRHMSKSAKTHVATYLEPLLGAGVDKINAPIFVAPQDIHIEDIVVVPTGDATIPDSNESEWTFVKRDAYGGPSDEIRVIEFNRNARVVITSLNDGGTASVVTVSAADAPKVFAGTAGNGLKIVFVSDDIDDAAGAIAYDPSANEIEVTIDTNVGGGNGLLTAAALETLLEGLTITAADDHLVVTVDTAGDGFSVADDVGVTEGVLAGGVDDLFPDATEPYSVIPPGIDENRLIPQGGTLELAIANSGAAATPATLVQIIYSIAQEL